MLVVLVVPICTFRLQILGAGLLMQVAQTVDLLRRGQGAQHAYHKWF